MSALTCTNPDFYRGVVEDNAEGMVNRRRTVIYSTLDELIIGQIEGAAHAIEEVFASDRNLSVHALNLMLAGTIEIPRGDIQIYCKNLIVPPGDTDEKTGVTGPGAVLDVSPKALEAPYTEPFKPALIEDAKPVPDPGASGDKIADTLQKGAGGYGASSDPAVSARSSVRFGKEGDHAGSITIICDSIELRGELVLRAKGGNGYPGCNGQNGGPNSDRVRGHGGKGGKGGKGGVGGKGGAITIRCNTINDATLLQSDISPGDPGINGSPGLGGSPQGDSGARADRVEPAKEGGLIQRTDTTRKELGRDFDEVFLLKVLQRAKKLYLFNQPTHFSGTETSLPTDEKAWKEIGELAHWLNDVLEAFSTYKSQAPLNERRKHSMVSAAYAMKSQFDSTLTYFGWAADWVPPLPFEVLKHNLLTSLTHRAQFEASFLSMVKDLAEAETKQMDVNHARASLRQAEANQKAVYQASLAELALTQPEIESTVVAFDGAKEHLLAVLKDFTVEVKKCFSCDMEKVLQAGESFAFTGGEGASALMMGGLQIYSLYQSALTKLPLNEGGSISKDHVVQEIVTLGKDIRTDANGALYDRDPKTGELRIKPGKRLLLTSLDRFDEEVQKLTNTLDKKCTAAVTAAIREFKQALNEKGEALLRYNIYVLRLAEQYDDYLDTLAKIDELNKQPQPLSPHWLGQVSHLARLYQEQMEESLKSISMLQRKLSFMTLDYKEPLNVVAGMDRLWQDGPKPNDEQMQQLIERVDRICQSLDNFDSNQKSGLIRLPADPNRRSALYVHIKAGALLDRFKKTGSLSFTATPGIAPLEPIVPVPGAAPPMAELSKPQELEQAPEIPVIGSDHYHDIRVSHARVRIYGAKVANPKTRIHIDISAGVRSTIIDAKRVPHTFFHRIGRAASVEHKADTAFDGEDNTDMGAGHVGQLTDKALDMIGLFTDWTISVPPATNTGGANFGLDWSGVTDLTVHFDVLARD
jgi:tetratricopeptide (TPR) repeat protein